MGDFLVIDDFTAITRQDLSVYGDTIDNRIYPRKQFTHPKDSVMAIIYARLAAKLKDFNNWNWVRF